jgi:hypothetical protein
MSVINLSHILVVVVVVFICVILLKWNTIEKIVNIDKTQTNEMNSTHCCEQRSCLNGICFESPMCCHSICCCDCCSLSTCCEQTNRIVCSNTKSIKFMFLIELFQFVCLKFEISKYLRL